MPRSLDEIISHADELARAFEAWEPDPSQETTTPEMRLRRAAWLRAEAERDVLSAVRTARDDNVPWATIGDALGTSAQAAQKRYTKATKSAKKKAPAKSAKKKAATKSATKSMAAAKSAKKSMAVAKTGRVVAKRAARHKV